MDVEKYISSGILELYVAGALTEEQNREVHQNAMDYPAIGEEIVAIEASILELSKVISPKISGKKGFEDLKIRIAHKEEPKVRPFPLKKSNWSAYTGWAAAILCAIGLFWFYNESAQLHLTMKRVEMENDILQQQIFEARGSLAKSDALLKTITDRNITLVALNGQKVSPDSYAKAYWNKEQKKVVIDAQGLPEPPDGFVYQVWSLKLDPLTPTSMGLLKDFTNDENKIFSLDNPNDSQAFGITLEPAGGSKTPTMEQLYTLGVVASS
jgi:anti-sigma-K factor RskA